VVAHHKTGVEFFDSPGWREATPGEIHPTGIDFTVSDYSSGFGLALIKLAQSQHSPRKVTIPATAIMPNVA